MEEFIHQNALELVGDLDSPPVFSHRNHDLSFYRFLLAVERLSGQKDYLPVLAAETVLQQCGDPQPGRTYRVSGQLRSFNNKSGTGNRLVISAYAQNMHPVESESENKLFLAGAICKPPTLRRTPLGRNISDIMLAVNRRYGRADYLPCIAWGQVATLLSQKDVGSCISFSGRFQSRIYTKQTDLGAEEHTAYEVSVMHLVPEGENEIFLL